VPLIVLLASMDSNYSDMDHLVDTQDAFQEVGVCDLVLQRSVGRALWIDMVMAARRAEATMEMMRKTIARDKQRSDNRLFWSTAHRTFEGLPKMNCELNPEATSDFSGGSVVNLGTRSLLEQIGKGSCSRVFLSRDGRSSELEAVKVVLKSDLSEPSRVSAICHEIQLGGRLKHPNIVRLNQALHGLRHIFLCMEYVGKNNLFAHLKRSACEKKPLKLWQIEEINKQLAGAVAYCHRELVAHRDIKPENVAIADVSVGGSLHIKLVDFGLAVDADTFCENVQGTMPFMAPEMLIGGGYYPVIADSFACGMVLLEMMCGVGTMSKWLNWRRTPRPESALGHQLKDFLGDSEKLRTCVNQLVNEPTNEEILSVLCGLLEPCPQKRMSVENAELALQPVEFIDALSGRDSWAGA
jgi:serine/threonine protein kinase